MPPRREDGSTARDVLQHSHGQDAVPRDRDPLPRSATVDESSPQVVEHPLQGVRFSAMTAPGPTGTRPEHASDCFAVRKKRLVTRFKRALLKVQEMEEKGLLPNHARWLLRTRLVFLEKPSSNKPRPIRVGEFLRAAFAKRLMRREGHALWPVFRSMHQWGVQMPGGAEAL
eukprot:7314478-Karenia_brevis.AAC.1